MPKTPKSEEDKKILCEIGKKIYEARIKAGIKAQRDLGEMINPDSASGQQTVQKWEAGTSEITLLNLIKLAKVLHLSLDELVMGTVDEVERKIEKKSTLREACEFLFLTLPKNTGATWSLSHSNLSLSGVPTFDVNEYPCINISIPMPPLVVYEISKDPPVKKMSISMYGKQMAQFADTVNRLNACPERIPEHVYKDLLSLVSTAPLSEFRSSCTPDFERAPQTVPSAESSTNLDVNPPSFEEAYRDQAELTKSTYAKK